MLGILLAASYGWTAPEAPDTNSPATGADLTTFSLEDLIHIKITSVSKKEQSLNRAAAAIYVLTQDEIRRSGATSIPEVLRLVPGVDVARIDATTWAISARGFNGQYADKMLVLVDGRSVYTPMFSGVFWDVLDTMMEDIDRIEVIRGPGASLWGANAVNGVINIITKRSKDTQGGLASAGGGTEEGAFAATRFGGKIGANTTYRVFGKFNRSNLLDSETGPAFESVWRRTRGGFRVDSRISEKDELMVEGDLYENHSQQTLTIAQPSAPFQTMGNDPLEASGADVTSSWRHRFSERSAITLKAYYDRYHREDSVLAETRNTVDFDFQHEFAVSAHHNLSWGAGARNTGAQTKDSFTLSYNGKLNDPLYNAFVQDVMPFGEGKFEVTVGSKFEHNRYTGFEIQPNARFMWSPTSRQSMWAAVSRAVVTPAVTFTEGRLNVSAFPAQGGLASYVSILGNPNYRSQSLLAYEAGYRTQFGKKLSLDLATFYNNYDHLQTHEPGRAFFENGTPPHLTIPITFANLMRGETYGLELAANLQPTAWWKITPSYSWLNMQLHRYVTSQDQSAESSEGQNPAHQMQLRSSIDLPKHFESDVAYYYVSALPAFRIPGYGRLDARLGWHASAHLEFSVAGQNLTDKRHVEFLDSNGNVPLTPVRRSGYGQITWRF